jgi:hypothetical protein
MIAKDRRLCFQLFEPVLDDVPDRDDSDEVAVVLHHQVALTLTRHTTHCVFYRFIGLAGWSGPHNLLDRQIMDRGLMRVQGSHHVTLGDEPNYRAM